MIKDKLINAETYFCLSNRIKSGLEWLKNENLDNIIDGSYEIDGRNLYANVQTYETKSDAKYEAHRQYIDIQYIVKGVEQIGVMPLDLCKSCVEYDSDKDIEFMNPKQEYEQQVLREGEFLILFPHDAHKPSIDYKNKQLIKKVVVKVKI